MEDTDLIARLYPVEKTGYARVMIEKHPHHIPPTLRPETRQSRSARAESNRVSLDDLPHLELRFSGNIPRASLGLVFGTDPDTCDVVLPKIPGISRRHFALTYKNKFDDGLHRLIVRDLGSTYGTIVTYDEKGAELRSKFDWIIDGFDATNCTNKIIVKQHENLTFQIVVARHDITSPTYIDNVERFRQGAASAEDLFGGPGLQSGLQTDRNSGTDTPVKDPILLGRRIAQGAFGVVNYHWNVSTGEVCWKSRLAVHTK